MASRFWPLFRLRVVTPTVELRYATDADLEALALLAADGIHEPGFNPFIRSWSTLPSPERERSVLQWHWRTRAEWSDKRWNLPLAVVRDGEVVGTQGFGASNFARVRAVNSGSWLALRHQGQGIGKEMRAAMLHLAFDGLGARVAYSGAWEDNPRSMGVSRALGYVENGDVIEARGDDDWGREIRFKLERDAWEAHRRDDIRIEGLEECRSMFGLETPAEPGV